LMVRIQFSQKQIELPAATGKRGWTARAPQVGRESWGWIRRGARILRAARGLDRARVFPPLAPNPNHRVATCRHRATTCRQDQAARFRFRIGRGLPACLRSVLPAASCSAGAGGAHHAVSPSGDHKWRDEAPGGKNAKPFAAFWVGITSQATSETGQSWMANARAPNQHGERKQGRSRPRTDNPPRASILARSMYEYLQIAPSKTKNPEGR